MFKYNLTEWYEGYGFVVFNQRIIPKNIKCSKKIKVRTVESDNFNPNAQRSTFKRG